MQALRKFPSHASFFYEVTEGCVPSKQEIYPRRWEKGIFNMLAKADPI